MKIQTLSRLKPFSHTPGTACFIPGTHWKLEAYPTLIKIGHYEIPLHVTGPVRDFTVELDLEHNCVWVFGQAKEGFYRLKIQATKKGFEIWADRTPKAGLCHGKGTLQAKEHFLISENAGFSLPENGERLSLGAHKKQDWDLVWRRFDLREILPVLFDLGQKTPATGKKPSKGPVNLLETGDWEAFCRAAFSKILVPRLVDDHYQGLFTDSDLEGHASHLLSEAAKKIRDLFFRQCETHLHLLPQVTFESGMLTHIQAPGIGELDLEWSKGMLRRAILRAVKNAEVFLDLQKGIKSYRVRTKLKEKGRSQKANDLLRIETGKTYYLDRFQK
ncbi:MAG: hypothetical protein HY069_05160 [Chlamydiia bacterium]|nr:hypothetical protein [Chlamydiia bacterium]